MPIYIASIRITSTGQEYLVGTFAHGGKAKAQVEKLFTETFGDRFGAPEWSGPSARGGVTGTWYGGFECGDIEMLVENEGARIRRGRASGFDPVSLDTLKDLANAITLPN